MFFSALLLLTNTAIFAGTTIPLTGGLVQPHQSIDVDLSNIVNNVDYTVHCAINATEATKTHFSISGAVMDFQMISAVLNSNLLNGNLTSGVNGAVNKGENDFVIPHITKNPIPGRESGLRLTISNLDDSVVENVHDCYADVAVK